MPDWSKRDLSFWWCTHLCLLQRFDSAEPWEWPGYAKRETVKLSHPSHGPLEDADTAGVSHISHRSGDGYIYAITAIHLEA